MFEKSVTNDMGSASVISVEEQLKESGMRLLRSPSSVDELLVVLDVRHQFLSCPFMFTF